MDIYERYMYRVNSKGSSPTESSLNAGKRDVNYKFASSPSYTLVLVDDNKTEAIVTSKSEYNEKEIIFRPDTKLNIGAVVEFRDTNYLLMEFIERDLDPKGLLNLCNNVFIAKGQSIRIVVGTNPFTGQPVYEYQEGINLSYPCIATKTMINEDLNLPINTDRDLIKVTLPYFDFKEDTFEMYEEKYQVKSIDKTKVINGVGLMTILGEGVQK